jgi:hypothetical protein
VLILFLAAVLFVIGERHAFAYVDPGTGSLLYQTALTIVLGLGLVFRRVRVSIVDFVKRLGGRGDATDSDRATPHQH